MPVKITTTEYKRVDLVQVEGRIDSSTAPQLEQALKKVTQEGRFRIVVDLAGCEFMSSAGLRVLIAHLKEAHQLNRGDVRLSRVPEKVKKAFDLAGFSELFQFFDNDVDAVGSF